MPTLRVHVLGDFCLIYGGEAVTTVVQPRLQALLAYLLLHRDAPPARRRLALLFWPDTGESQARTNLRQLLFHLRRSLPGADELLLAGSKTVQWSPDATYTSDVMDLESKLAQADAAARDGLVVQERKALESAIYHYGGDLLPECYDDWIIPERERLSQAYGAALERLVLLMEAEREYGLAIGHAERLLNYDPWCEVSYRRLMRLHALNGDRASALRVYQICAELMARELGVEPDVKTREVYEQLLSNELPMFMRGPPQSPWAQPILAGRHDEWNRLRSAWRWASAGNPTLVLISGEVGIGKTRLAEELLEWATQQGIRTGKTRAYAAEGELAYGPLIELLRATLYTTGLLRLEDVWLSELSRLLPDLLNAQQPVSGPKPLVASEERQRLFEASARAVLGEADRGEKELLLLIDDLQWCDRETLEWLHYLLHFAHEMKLLILGAFRPEEVHGSHPLMVLLFDLRLREQVVELVLEPLNREETAALAEQIAGRNLERQQVAWLYGYTEGNPLFIVETVGAWMNGTQAEQPVTSSDIIPADHPFEMTDIPLKIRAVILTRLQQLSPAARELADLAATIGRTFTVEVLVQANKSDEETVLRGLDELWWRRVIREQSESVYGFSHDRIREVIYSQLMPARRQLLHRNVAEGMEHVYAPHLDAVSGQIAVHFERAGRGRQAAIYYERANRLRQET